MTEQILDRVIQAEAEFFDSEAGGLDDAQLKIPDDQIERYRRATLRASNTPKDALFARLLPLEGKTVLDYGCGTGDISCELALCGARVTAFDLSPMSIAKAQRRAELHGVADRIQFDIRQGGTTGYPSAHFDIVVGSAILHHLHQDLPGIFGEIDRVLKRPGTACFIEPVANSAVLRCLRRLAPVKTHATPDERQLYYEDFAPLRQHFAQVDFHHFYCLERMHRVLGGWVSDPLRWLDHQAQRWLPLLRRFYGTVLVVAHH